MQLKDFFLISVVVLASAVFGHTQSSRAVLLFSPGSSGGWQSEIVEIPLQGVEPFLAFSLAWQGEEGAFEVRFSTDGRQWGEWEALPPDTHGEYSSVRHYSQLHFTDASHRFVQLRAPMAVDQLEAHCYNPGKTGASSSGTAVESRDPDYCPCPQPDYEGRGDWCPDGTCPEAASPATTVVTHLIVHHSAGTNDATDWAAVVRSIWDFHVIVREPPFDDIGYNWLIDPNGVIYEGRGDNIRGAHFCGNNTGTMGVCVMGNFTDITPSAEARASLATLLAWKACDRDIDPLGEAYHSSSEFVLNNISGHRDGCPTECPGDSFYPLLPSIRQAVADYIAGSCAAISPPSGLMATPTSGTSARLEWQDATANEDAFLIERAPGFNGPYAQIGAAPANATSYEDFGLDEMTGYYYRIRAANAQDTSQYSNRAFVFTTVTSTHGPLGSQYLRLFPNPVEETLTASLDAPLTGEVQLRLRGVDGRLLWQGRAEGGNWQRDIPMGGLPNGLYVLQLVHAEAQASYKVIKE